MEQIIKKAIEGGWKPEMKKEGVIITGEKVFFDFIENPSARVSHQTSFSFSEIVLDPLFWQSIGKACGWKEQPYLCLDCLTIGSRKGNHMMSCVKKDRYGSWKDEALRFHEINLTEGWDAAVTYLESITHTSEE